MWVIGQSRSTSLDLMGLTIGTAGGKDQQGKEFLIFQLVGFGIGGFNILLGEYNSETAARRMFEDILNKLKRGTDFYDVSEEEKNILKG